MFNIDPNNPPDAISAVKALAKANAAGQRMYQITQANSASILSNIHHDRETMDEIRAALAVGKEVITHTDAVRVPGWSGAGYIILDPVTGSGAYKIAGGSNGSFFDDYPSGDISAALFGLSAFISLAYGGPLLALFVFIITIISIFNLIISTLKADLVLKGNGCPPAMSYLLYAISITAGVLPKFFNLEKLINYVINIASFVTKGGIKGASRACSFL
jgi:hypothetical protein